MEETFRGLAAPACPGLVREEVPRVPGAFVIRGALSARECDALAAHVRELHCEWREGRQRRRAGETKQRHAGASAPSSSSTSSDSLSATPPSGNASASRLAQPRRASQHHLPYRIAQDAMRPLSCRIREFLPEFAGPDNRGTLLPAGHEISPFLRCYHYKKGDMSTPHYDKSFTTHYKPRDEKNNPVQMPFPKQPQGQPPRPGQLLTFSAYSVLLYLNDDFEGGETTFFRHDPAIRVSRRGLAPHPDDLHKLESISKVVPLRGDILVFPHGKFKGCYQDPLHEGSILTRGEKVIIRTDLVFAAAPKPKSGRKQYKKRGKKRDKDEMSEALDCARTDGANINQVSGADAQKRRVG